MTARNYYANAFTTGGRATDRFTLQSVVLGIDTAVALYSKVRIYTSTANGRPNTKVGNGLILDSTPKTGNNTYQAIPLL